MVVVVVTISIFVYNAMVVVVVTISVFLFIMQW